MIDTHCHIADEAYDADRKKVIDNAFSDGIEYIVVPGTCPSDIKSVISVAEEYERIYCAVGVHPHDAKLVDSVVLAELASVQSNKIKAIGEIGLDYHYDYSTHEEQHFAFTEQIKIAQRCNLPIIVHNREADSDMLDMLNEYYRSNDNTRKGVVHCYSSDTAMLEKVLNLGFFISYTANITFKNTNLDEQVAATPLDRLMLETDSPYMTPAPNRGKRNVPQSVKIVAEKISQIKKTSIEDIIDMTTKNAKYLFNLPSLILLLLLTALVQFSPKLYSQIAYDDEYEDEYEESDPYVRRIGFGPVVGTNTFVDRYTTGLKSFSYEGLLNAGGMVNVRVLDWLIVQGVYTYSKNELFVNRLPDSIKNSEHRWLDPNYHKALEFNFIGMLRPKKMVNFYGSLGATYFMNKLSRYYQAEGETVASKRYDNDNMLGINAGVGAFVNISLGNAGTLAINAEWKLGFRVDKSKLPYDPRLVPNAPGYKNPVEYTSMSSIPRGGVIWYIPFVK